MNSAELTYNDVLSAIRNPDAPYATPERINTRPLVLRSFCFDEGTWIGIVIKDHRDCSYFEWFCMNERFYPIPRALQNMLALGLSMLPFEEMKEMVEKT